MAERHRMHRRRRRFRHRTLARPPVLVGRAAAGARGRAIGQLGSFPPEGTDTTTLTAQVTSEGFFVPLFSSPRPSAVDCCAPGVAVISGLPPASYGPLSAAMRAAGLIAGDKPPSPRHP